jgi:hypothetical protein
MGWPLSASFSAAGFVAEFGSGLRATPTSRLPRPRWTGRGALGARRATEIKSAVNSRRSFMPGTRWPHWVPDFELVEPRRSARLCFPTLACSRLPSRTTGYAESRKRAFIYVVRVAISLLQVSDHSSPAPGVAVTLGPCDVLCELTGRDCQQMLDGFACDAIGVENGGSVDGRA